MSTTITWKRHGDYGEITDLNGWSAEVHDCDGHGLPHPEGFPYLWFVEPTLKGGRVSEGFAASREAARKVAEPHLRRWAVTPGPKDPTVGWASDYGWYCRWCGVEALPTPDPRGDAERHAATHDGVSVSVVKL